MRRNRRFSATAFVSIRTASGLSQAGLAHKIGFTRQHVTKVEGGSCPSVEFLEKAAAALRVDIRRFFR